LWPWRDKPRERWMSRVEHVASGQAARFASRGELWACMARMRREINWDGGGNNQTTVQAGNPFAGFQVTRGALFTDVHQPNGSGPSTKLGNREASTLIEYFGADGEQLFSRFVPVSPGDGSLSFFGIVFDDAHIARVRITSGNVAPEPDDEGNHDVVLMHDFLFGEPQSLP
jgi:hypothetical protein